jgi:hypothetical protein
MTETPLDRAAAAMAATPGEDAARLAFYDRLAAAELFLLLAAEPEGDSVTPELFEVEGTRYALAFDTEDRLSGFTGRPAPYAALSGRTLADLAAAEGLGLGLNLGAASETLLPPEALAWLAETLAAAPAETEARPLRIAPPAGLPETLVTALDARLAATAGLVSTPRRGPPDAGTARPPRRGGCSRRSPGSRWPAGSPRRYAASPSPRMRPERMLRRQRFLAEHIERRMRHLPRIQRGQQRVVVDQRPAPGLMTTAPCGSSASVSAFSMFSVSGGVSAAAAPGSPPRERPRQPVLAAGSAPLDLASASGSSPPPESSAPRSASAAARPSSPSPSTVTGPVARQRRRAGASPVLPTIWRPSRGDGAARAPSPIRPCPRSALVDHARQRLGQRLVADHVLDPGPEVQHRLAAGCRA